MTHLQVFLVATITWIAWLPAQILQYRARKDPGAITLFPALLMPFFVWGLTYVLHLADLPRLVTAIGVFHVVMLAALAASMLISAWRIHSRRRQAERSLQVTAPGVVHGAPPMAKVEVRFAFRLATRKQFVIACVMVEGTVSAGMRALIWVDGEAYWAIPILSVEFIDRIASKESFVGLVCAEQREDDAEIVQELCSSGTVIEVAA
jgi:hypothetical protein